MFSIHFSNVFQAVIEFKFVALDCKSWRGDKFEDQKSTGENMGFPSSWESCRIQWLLCWTVAHMLNIVWFNWFWYFKQFEIDLYYKVPFGEQNSWIRFTIDHWCGFSVLAHKFVGIVCVHMLIIKFFHVICILYILFIQLSYRLQVI